ncbi:MAG: methyltransferase domain-containing protein [Planctomycetota bacterium]|nr:methyltransferase domain-containing protein [Planctomycetota bacterium]
MLRRISEYSTFVREFRRTFETTGALLPSGRLLARAMVRPISAHETPVRILEVGAGTGAVTKEILRHVKSDDHFDVVELNDRFVQVLQRRFATEPAFQAVADRTTILHAAVQDLQVTQPYDFIISGLPLNNFSTQLVKEIFQHLLTLLRPGGTLSFYEYLWIRRFKMLVSTPKERRRVAEVGSLMKSYLKQYEFHCDTIFVNLPPALAHHLRLEGNGNGSWHAPIVS